jgi:hypothetical protein
VVAVVVFVPRTIETWDPSITTAAELLIDPAAPGELNVRVAALPTASRIEPPLSPKEFVAT